MSKPWSEPFVKEEEGKKREEERREGGDCGKTKKKERKKFWMRKFEITCDINNQKILKLE